MSKKRYNRPVKPIARTAAIALAALLVAGCFWQNKEEGTPQEPSVYGARAGLLWTMNIIQSGADVDRIRPGSLLGAFVTQYLMQTTGVRSARAGIAAQVILFYGERLERSESFILLEELAAILDVDINDMLNRSIERSEAFDTYIESLTTLLQGSNSHVRGLEQQLEVIVDDRREKRKSVSDIKSTLNRALREQDYATASEQQEMLIDAESELAEVTAREEEIDGIMDLFDDLIDVGEERVVAMQENREIILAGLTVVKMPGIEDLELIENINRRDLNNRRSIFDPTAD